MTLLANKPHESGIVDDKRNKHWPTYRCGLGSHHFQTGEEVNCWHKASLSYYIANRADNELGPAEWDASIHRAFESWARVSPLRFSRTEDRQEADLLLDVYRTNWHSLEIPPDVYGWATMPTGDKFDGPLTATFVVDAFRAAGETPQQKSVFLQTVMAHEIGHLMGLTHASPNTALMQPFYQPALVEPHEVNDIPRICELYPYSPFWN